MTTELTGIRREVRDAEIRGASLHVSGVGKERAAASLCKIVAEAPDGVIMVGFCGAADPALETGDIHVADVFHATDADSARYPPIAANPGLASCLTEAARSNGCRVATVPSVTLSSVAGIAIKSAVYSSLGAASVNMEDYWAARAARSAGVRFASVRAVLDTSDQEIPPWISVHADSAYRAAWSIIAHPGRAPTLLHLWRQAELARRQLTRCVITALGVLALHQTSRMVVFQ